MGRLLIGSVKVCVVPERAASCRSRLGKDGASAGAIVPDDTTFAQLPLNLCNRLELYRINAQRTGGFDVCLDIVGEEAFPGKAIRSLNRLLIDEREGLQRSGFVGKYKGVEVLYVRVSFTNHLEVDRIGVGEQDQAVV